MKLQPMKKSSLGILALLLGLAIHLSGCTAKGNAHAEFWVRGNCDMCKETIEKALKGTKGVTEATYDLDAHTAIVDYDSSQVDVTGLHQACANAGYETKVSPASADAYEALPKCCKKDGAM